jgi:hypothetical protein
MTMASFSHITRYGLPGFDHVPFGSTPVTFIAIASSALRRRCRTPSRGCCCLRATAPSLPAREVNQTLGAAWDDVGDAIRMGALRILNSARVKGLALVQLWCGKENRALAAGYNGLRIAGGLRASSRRGPGRRSWSTSIRERAVVT